jgi:hypothetical protein
LLSGTRRYFWERFDSHAAEHSFMNAAW